MKKTVVEVDLIGELQNQEESEADRRNDHHVHPNVRRSRILNLLFKLIDTLAQALELTAVDADVTTAAGTLDIIVNSDRLFLAVSWRSLKEIEHALLQIGQINQINQIN